MNRIRGGTLFAFALIAVISAGVDAVAQTAIDTMQLAIVPPDSIYVRREGASIVVGWYPPDSSVASITGSRDFSNWYVNDPSVSRVGITGLYRGDIDRTVRVSRLILGLLTRDQVGVTPSIPMRAELTDRSGTYTKDFDIGALHYTPGNVIPLTMKREGDGVPLDLGFGLTFASGVVDTAFGGVPAFFEIDLQTYEGFHVWRGLSPYPTKMSVIVEYSRDDAYLLGEPADSLYFLEWPKLDGRGRPYFEHADDDVFVGFTYFYHVSCFDKGYFKGRYQFNKRDNFICDEDPEYPLTPGDPVVCEDVAREIVMTMNTSSNVRSIYTVPNPYRTGTSAESSPYYHNFPDASIKFFNMPPDGEIKIYTVSGDLVWEHRHQSPEGDDGVVSWNVRNREGGEVSSGVYIWRVESSNGEHFFGRIVVIR